MKCQCDSCRRLALSGKYICHSCAERYPDDGIRWVRTGPNSIRIFVRTATHIEVERLQMPDDLLIFDFEVVVPLVKRVKAWFASKIKGVLQHES